MRGPDQIVFWIANGNVRDRNARKGRADCGGLIRMRTGSLCFCCLSLCSVWFQICVCVPGATTPHDAQGFIRLQYCVFKPKWNRAMYPRDGYACRNHAALLCTGNRCSTTVYNCVHCLYVLTYNSMHSVSKTLYARSGLFKLSLIGSRASGITRISLGNRPVPKLIGQWKEDAGWRAGGAKGGFERVEKRRSSSWRDNSIGYLLGTLILRG